MIGGILLTIGGILIIARAQVVTRDIVYDGSQGKFTFRKMFLYKVQSDRSISVAATEAFTSFTIAEAIELCIALLDDPEVFNGVKDRPHGPGRPNP